MSKDFHILPLADAAAMALGRVVLAWGGLDHHIETLMVEMWKVTEWGNYANGIVNNPPEEPRANQRIRLLRQSIVKLVGDDPDNWLGAYDGIVTRWKALEPIRASFAHGRTYFRGNGADAYVISSVWSKTGVPEKPRDWVARNFTFAELDGITKAIEQLEADFAHVAQQVRIPALHKYLANEAAKQGGPVRSLSPATNGVASVWRADGK